MLYTSYCGSGLFNLKHITEAHGGEVRVESEPGRGATFFFTLPGEKANPAQAEKLS